MTIQIKNGSLDTSISRRGFVAGAAGMTFAFTLGGIGHGGEALGATQPTKFNAWVSIAPDNTISIICPAAEMGQRGYTSLPLILAEELDADWSKVKTEFASPIRRSTAIRTICSTARRSRPRACRCQAISCRCAWPVRRHARFCSMRLPRNRRCRLPN